MEFCGREVRIRRGRPEDYQALVEMQQDGPIPITLDDIETLAECDSCLYVATCEGHACGFVLARLDVSGLDATSAVVHRLYVCPAARRAGIGSALLRRVAGCLSAARPAISILVPLSDGPFHAFLKHCQVNAIKSARLIPHHRSGVDLVLWCLSPRPHLIKFRKGSEHAGSVSGVERGVQHQGH